VDFRKKALLLRYLCAIYAPFMAGRAAMSHRVKGKEERERCRIVNFSRIFIYWQPGGPAIYNCIKYKTVVYKSDSAHKR
jgi:hypothetical protein